MKTAKGLFARKMVGRNAQPAPSAQPVVHAAPAVPAQVQWDATTFKVQLKMARNRIDIQRGKKSNEIDATRSVIAGHLAANKETLARIQAERILRERVQIEAFDVIETFIELLAASHTVFAVQRHFDTAPEDMKESVASVVYASTRLNVPELHKITRMFENHFGVHIIAPICKLQGPHIVHVNKILARNLEGGTPDGYLVLEELSRIASEHQLSWIPPPEDINLDQGGGHGPSDPGYYRPVRPYPGNDQTGPANFGSIQPMNIPGHNPYDQPPYPGFPSDPEKTPSAPPSAPPAPFEPSGNASGTLYPFPDANGSSEQSGAHFPSSSGGMAPPPPPPPASFLSDDALEAKFRNIKDNYGKP